MAVSIAIVWSDGVYVIPYDLATIIPTVLICWWRWRRAKR